MNLENATQVYWEGQKAIGLKEDDVKKLSISQTASSSFSVDNSSIQGDVTGGQVPEDHIINTSVIDNVGGSSIEPSLQTEVTGGGEPVYSSVVPEPVVEPVSEVQSNIFDNPQMPSTLQTEVIPEPTVVSAPEYSIPSSFELEGQQTQLVNDIDRSYVPQEPLSTDIPLNQEPERVDQQSENLFYQPQEVSSAPLDTPQTFYEKQVDQDVQGGFANVPMDEVKSDIPNITTDPVVIMLDEAIRTVNERSKASIQLETEIQVLRNENFELKNENDRLKQQMIELNNKVLIAEAQRQAAEQTLAGARMAESGMVNNGQARVYQPQQVPQTNYYQQAA